MLPKKIKRAKHTHNTGVTIMSLEKLRDYYFIEISDKSKRAMSKEKNTQRNLIHNHRSVRRRLRKSVIVSNCTIIFNSFMPIYKYNFLDLKFNREIKAPAHCARFS